MMNTCLNGDSLRWMNNTTNPFADLIIADPPFNIGYQYDIYNDKKSEDDYLSWCEKWLLECKRLLHNDGNMLVCMGDEHITDIDALCKKIGLRRENWIIWHYKFGQSGKLETRKRFTKSKVHILRYAQSRNPYFDAASVAVPSDRQKLYNDKRADPRGKCPDDVFTFKRIAGTHHEREKGIATQMPVSLLRIWVRAMCKPGGVVFDPFPGSGASLIAAKQENRKYLGVELSPNYTKNILDRLNAI